MRDAVSDSTWRLYLADVQPVRLDGTTLVLAVAPERRGWIARRYTRLLQGCARAVLGPTTTVEVVAAGSDATQPGRDTAAAGAAGGGATGRAHASRGAIPFNPRLTFEQFVIGDSNRLAHAASLAVAELPGIAYNPLYICGPPGLGKTHLLHSIANYVNAYGSGLTVRYTTAEAFTSDFTGALRSKDIGTFKAAYRGVDVLLVDDIQFLQSKERTEEEFFHTFNALQGDGAQIVLTSDRPPRDLEAMEDRLRARFEAGLVADVRAPDRATRLTILRKRVAQDGIEHVDPRALDLIADRVTSNIRALEGALIRVVAAASLDGRHVTEDVAFEVLGGERPSPAPSDCTVRGIQERTCALFGIQLEDMLSASRATPVAWPRQVAMYLARELTDNSLPAIASEFGGRSHTTVLHAYRRTAERIATDRDAFDTVQRLAADLGRNRADRRS